MITGPLRSRVADLVAVRATAAQRVGLGRRVIDEEVVRSEIEEERLIRFGYVYSLTKDITLPNNTSYAGESLGNLLATYFSDSEFVRSLGLYHVSIPKVVAIAARIARLASEAPGEDWIVRGFSSWNTRHAKVYSGQGTAASLAAGNPYAVFVCSWVGFMLEASERLHGTVFPSSLRIENEYVRAGGFEILRSFEKLDWASLDLGRWTSEAFSAWWRSCPDPFGEGAEPTIETGGVLSNPVNCGGWTSLFGDGKVFFPSTLARFREEGQGDMFDSAVFLPKVARGGSS